MLSELGAAHPLLGAVHVAFAEHRPLVLSPDAVWLTILAGVTQHVRLNAERLRDRFVAHGDKKRLDVVVNVSLRQQPEAISEVVPRLRELLAAEVPEAKPTTEQAFYERFEDVELLELGDTFGAWRLWAGTSQPQRGRVRALENDSRRLGRLRHHRLRSMRRGPEPPLRRGVVRRKAVAAARVNLYLTEHQLGVVSPVQTKLPTSSTNRS